MNRRNFLKALGMTTLSSSLFMASSCTAPTPKPAPVAVDVPEKNRGQVRQVRQNAVIKPPRLERGDTVGLINPAGASLNPAIIGVVQDNLAEFGLKVKVGSHVMDRYGYLAGRDQDRASDVNAMFADPSVRAILPVRGGWGCNRMLRFLDYDLIRENPKIVMGYSDITSLLVALYARTGLVTFHGPVGISNWNAFSADYVRRILFLGEATVFQNPSCAVGPPDKENGSMQVIAGGRARGKLVGGNLSVLTAMIGSEYLPDWRGSILFVEDVRERVYRVDRMITQLKLAGILDQINGFVFGKCIGCETEEDSDAFTLREVLADHLRPLGIPVWYGAMIGHINDKFTVPLGVDVEIDAGSGTIRMLEPAVS